ncbi:hypothetical protein ACS0TY_034248 [Phlomoides rotata]
MVWNLTKDGSYSVKIAYQEIAKRKAGDNTNLEEIGLVWNKAVPLKIAAFSWKLIQDHIPTIWNLLQRGAFNPNYSTKCRVCGKFDEDTKHLFFECHAAAAVWERVPHWFDFNCSNLASGEEHMREFVMQFKGINKNVGNLIWQCTVWNIWLRRNSIIFSGLNISDEEVFEKVCMNSFAWLKNRNLISLVISFSDWFRNPAACFS